MDTFANYLIGLATGPDEPARVRLVVVTGGTVIGRVTDAGDDYLVIEPDNAGRQRTVIVPFAHIVTAQEVL